MSRNDTLLIDADHSEPSIETIHHFLRMWGMRTQWIRIDRTKRGLHYIIRCRHTAHWSNESMVAMQSILGSDPKREALNLMRCLLMRSNKHSSYASKRWNILFVRKL